MLSFVLANFPSWSPKNWTCISFWSTQNVQPKDFYVHTCWKKIFTCCTSAAVLRNSSIYRFPRICLCFFRAFWAYSSQEKSTKASPVGRPSGYLTKSRPSAPSVTGLSGPRKDSTSWDVAVNGSPRMRIITWFSLDRNWATSLDVPDVGQQQ